ncbi:MAG: hypothetical protein ABI761_04845 [Saprospiraceae bacterium]
MKHILAISFVLINFVIAYTQSIELYPKENALLKFAAAEIKSSIGKYDIHIIADSVQGIQICNDHHLPPPVLSLPQAYSIRKINMDIWVLSTHSIGAMYGGLDVAEALRLKHPEWLNQQDHQPLIEERGIKFNIPLDLRSPSYSDASDAFQANIPEVWKESFWQEYFDAMARNKMNVMSWWSLHPFPSMVIVPEFPDVALNDVWRTKAKYDDNSSSLGLGLNPPYLFDSIEVVKKITIQEKIKYWQKIMQMADDRGIRIYLMTWNIFTYGAEGKYGITRSQTNDTTIAYFRASVREMIKTYPLLKGIGITAGEGMDNKRTDEYKNEAWLWKTYGLGINDGLKTTPGRDFRLIHRFHWTSMGEIKQNFKDLQCRLDLSLKYAIAHMYSIPNPPFVLPAFDILSEQNKSWLTIRNDDIYSMRWANVDYARQFMNALPPLEKVAGYYMGSDGYCLGRDYLNKNTLDHPPLVYKKQWVSNMIWGRLSFDPTLPNSVFEENIRYQFGGMYTHDLIKAWDAASMIFPFITRFVWGDIDLKWFPEANLSHKTHKGFYTVDEYIRRQPMEGSQVSGIAQWLHDPTSVGSLRSPLSIADSLDRLTNTVFTQLKKLPKHTSSDHRELSQTLSDIEAFALIGKYYSYKIRSAYELALFDKTGQDSNKLKSLQYISKASGYWDRYATIYSAKNKPALYNRVGYVDVNALKVNVRKDLDIIRNWKPGSIHYVKTKSTEATFQK